MVAFTIQLLDAYGPHILRAVVSDMLTRGVHDRGAMAILCEQRRKRRSGPPPLAIQLGDYVSPVLLGSRIRMHGPVHDEHGNQVGGRRTGSTTEPRLGSTELAIAVGSVTITVSRGFDADLLREVVAALGGDR